MPLLGPWASQAAKARAGAGRPPAFLVVEVDVALPERGLAYAYLVAAGIWRARDIGAAPREGLAQAIDGRIDDLLEHFVEEHYCANLARPAK